MGSSSAVGTASKKLNFISQDVLAYRRYGRIFKPAEYGKVKRIPCVGDESLQVSLTDATDGIDIRYIPVI